MPLADACCSFWLDLCLTCSEHIFWHMDGVVHFAIYYGFIFVSLSFSLDHRNDDSGCC